MVVFVGVEVILEVASFSRFDHVGQPSFPAWFQPVFRRPSKKLNEVSKPERSQKSENLLGQLSPKNKLFCANKFF